MVDLPRRTRPGKLTDASVGWKARDEVAQSIRSLDLVSANGELLKVNEDNHPELFWALRGSGSNNFGIVASLTFQAYRIPELIQGFIRWDWQHFADFADAFQRWLPTLDNKINTIAHLERKDLT